MSDDDIIAVVKAHKEGKQIQWRYLTSHGGKPPEWYPESHGGDPDWDFSFYEYRVMPIKPEPRKPREWLIPIGSKITVNSNGTTSHDIPMMVGALGEYVKVREVIE